MLNSYLHFHTYVYTRGSNRPIVRRGDDGVLHYMCVFTTMVRVARPIALGLAYELRLGDDDDGGGGGGGSGLAFTRACWDQGPRTGDDPSRTSSVRLNKRNTRTGVRCTLYLLGDRGRAAFG